MKKINKICLVGAGGIGCSLAPILSRMCDIVIVDEDNYEPKNVSRQFPALTSAGNKAEVLMDMIDAHTIRRVQAIPHYIKDLTILNHSEMRDVEMIVSGVDNNESRRIITEVAGVMGIPAILAGNEHDTGEAHLFVPAVYNPFDFFVFKDDPHLTPWGCNSDKTLEEFPQTVMANFLASGAAIHLLVSWEKVKNPINAVCYSRFDPLSSEFKRVRDLVPQE